MLDIYYTKSGFVILICIFPSAGNYFSLIRLIRLVQNFILFHIPQKTTYRARSMLFMMTPELLHRTKGQNLTSQIKDGSSPGQFHQTNSGQFRKLALEVLLKYFVHLWVEVKLNLGVSFGNGTMGIRAQLSKNMTMGPWHIGITMVNAHLYITSHHDKV